MAFNEHDINILREQIQLLEIENDKLRKENEILKNKSRTSSNSKNSNSIVNSNTINKLLTNFNNKTKGCTCKGNCGSRVCGCMKKKLQCSEACKCNTKLCKNKEQDKENHESAGLSSLIQQDARNNVPETTKRIHHLTESTNPIDEIFYEASETDLESTIADLNAAKKLTFLTDDDSPDKVPLELLVIEETNEVVERNKRKSLSNIKKILRNHKGSSTNKAEKQNVAESKLNKTKKKTDSNKDDVKRQRKGSTSKQTTVVETGPENVVEHLFDNLKINSRSRRNRGPVQNEKENTENGEIQPENKIPEFIKSRKSTGVTSCIKSISKLKQPSDINKFWPMESEERVEEEIPINSNLTRNNSLKSSTTRSTRAISSEETSGHQRVSRLRRSLSVGTIPSKSEKSAQRKLQKSKSLSRENINKESRNLKRSPLKESLSKTLQKSVSSSRESLNEETKTLTRSQSKENLTDKPFKALVSRVSNSFRKSQERASASILQNTLKFTLTPVQESPQNLQQSINSNKGIDKTLKFDPMQPTRQLSRSPIPAVAIIQNSEVSIPDSPPIFSRFLDSYNIKVASPPLAILQDLNSEEVDPDEFQSKLVSCRKCKRKFFPHRIKLHEVVCHKT